MLCCVLQERLEKQLDATAIWDWDRSNLAAVKPDWDLRDLKAILSVHGQPCLAARAIEGRPVWLGIP